MRFGIVTSSEYFASFAPSLAFLDEKLNRLIFMHFQNESLESPKL
jgi:hypothetical protein